MTKPDRDEEVEREGGGGLGGFGYSPRLVAAWQGV